MRKEKIKWHRKKAKVRNICRQMPVVAYDLATKLWNIFLGTALIWGPIVFTIFAGGIIWLLRW